MTKLCMRSNQNSTLLIAIILMRCQNDSLVTGKRIIPILRRFDSKASNNDSHWSHKMKVTY